MRVNVNKTASYATFLGMWTFTSNKNQFSETCIIYLYVNIIKKKENDHFNSNNVIV